MVWLPLELPRILFGQGYGIQNYVIGQRCLENTHHFLLSAQDWIHSGQIQTYFGNLGEKGRKCGSCVGWHCRNVYHGASSTSGSHQGTQGNCQIALRAGMAIVPVYGFGHMSMYSIIVDPFGILQALSIWLDTALAPFLGHWFWFLGSPRALGHVPGGTHSLSAIDEPTVDVIEMYHTAMVEDFRGVLNQHKAVYGWEDEELGFP